jgi:hypothetical protein
MKSLSYTSSIVALTALVSLGTALVPAAYATGMASSGGASGHGGGISGAAISSQAGPSSRGNAQSPGTRSAATPGSDNAETPRIVRNESELDHGQLNPTTQGASVPKFCDRDVKLANCR